MSENDSGVHNPLSFGEKFDLKKEIGLLAQLPKQNLPDAFKRISKMLEAYKTKVVDPAKLDQVRHYLDNYGQDNSQKQ